MFRSHAKWMHSNFEHVNYIYDRNADAQAVADVAFQAGLSVGYQRPRRVALQTHTQKIIYTNLHG